MRRRLLALLAFAATVAVILTGCVSAAPRASVPDSQLWGNWKLVSASDANGPLDLGAFYVSLRVGAGAHSGGVLVCGPYAAKVTGGASNGVVFVSARKPSSERCADSDNNSLERRYLRDLGSITRAVVGRTPAVAGTAQTVGVPSVTVLTLTAGGTELVYHHTPTPPLESIMGTTWVLADFPADAQTLDELRDSDRSVLLTFDSPSSFQLGAACQVNSNSFDVTGHTVRVTGGETTSFADCTPDLQRLDATLDATLTSSSFSAVRHDDTLIVTPLENGLPAAVFREYTTQGD